MTAAHNYRSSTFAVSIYVYIYIYYIYIYVCVCVRVCVCVCGINRSAFRKIYYSQLKPFIVIFIWFHSIIYHGNKTIEFRKYILKTHCIPWGKITYCINLLKLCVYSTSELTGRRPLKRRRSAMDCRANGQR